MKLKNDRFRKARGGYARLLEISCASCNTKLFTYQKDGPGIIKRLYTDRIDEELHTNTLTCKNCGTIIGSLIIYEKENRPAYIIFIGKIKKKIMRDI